MFYSLRRQFQMSAFKRHTAHLLPTRPIEVDRRSNFGLLSQLYPGDVDLYVVALHTFCQYLRPNRIEVVGDRLTESHCNHLRTVCPSIEVHAIESVQTVGLPSGGCWERLATIVDRSREQYTIQLDADTLSLAPLDAVATAIDANRSFTLGTSNGTEFSSVVQAGLFAERYLGKTSNIQVVAEAKLPTLFGPEYRYVRGNAAFAGFAAKRHSLDDVFKLSAGMDRMIGNDRWREWGSEQVASNFSIANAQDAFVLPLDSYICYEPGLSLDGMRLVHFMGTHRFADGVYGRLARDALKRIAA